MDISSIFNVLDEIRKESKIIRRGKKEALQIESFLTQIEEFKHRLHFRTWAQVFYSRFYSTKTLLSEKQVEGFKSLLYSYKSLQPVPPKINIVNDIIHYLDTHTDDPDNAIIGIVPHDSMVNRLVASEEQRQSYLSDTSRENLISKIVQWGEMKDDKAIANEVRKFSQMLTSQGAVVSPLKRGDLIIVKTSNVSKSSFQFGRVEEVLASGQNARVFLTPQETDVPRTLPRDHVFSLSADVKQNLREIRFIEKMIKDPVDVLTHTWMGKVKELTNQYLVDVKAIPSLEAIERWGDNTIDISQIGQIRRSLSELNKIKNDPNLDIYKSITEMCNKSVEEFYSTIDQAIFFIPSREKSLAQLQNFSATFVSLAKHIVQKFVAVCDGALMQLSMEKRDIINGIRKQELSDWWLALIKERVENFLKSHNFDLTAVPANYIDEPPKSMLLVNSNLNIIQAIMKVFNGRLDTSLQLSDYEKNLQKDLLDMINDLKTEIYSVIENFISSAELIIRDHFEIEDEIPFDVIIVNGLIKLTEDRMDKKISESIKQLMKDMEYVREMKKLEDINDKIESKDIVPITGLIISRFVRIMNELQTVKELWEKKM